MGEREKWFIVQDAAPKILTVQLTAPTVVLHFTQSKVNPTIGMSITDTITKTAIVIVEEEAALVYSSQAYS